jgi:hypothetical protein
MQLRLVTIQIYNTGYEMKMKAFSWVCGVYINWRSNLLLLLQRSLLYRAFCVTAVFISCHIGSVIPTPAILTWLKKGSQSTSGYTFTPCVGSFNCLGNGIDTQVQGISVLHLIHESDTLDRKWRQRGEQHAMTPNLLMEINSTQHLAFIMEV